MQADHKPFLMEACRGSAAGRALAASTGNINYIWLRMSIGIKRMIARGGRIMPGPAIPERCIDVERLDELAQGDEQRLRDIRLSLGLEGTVQRLPATLVDGERDPPTGHGQEAPPAKRSRASPVGETFGALPGLDSAAAHNAEVQQPEPARGTKRPREQDRGLEAEYIMPWEREPDWMPAHLARRRGRDRADEVLVSDAERDDPQRPVDRGTHSPRRRPGEKRKSGQLQMSSAHELAEAGPLLFCMRCARYANRRFGSGLKGPCRQAARLSQNSVASRLRRLLDGKHPITGEPLE